MKKTDYSKCWQEYEVFETLILCKGNGIMRKLFWKGQFDGHFIPPQTNNRCVDVCVYKDSYTNVPSNFICNPQ